MSANGLLALVGFICWVIGLGFFYLDVIVVGITFWLVTLYLVNIVLIGQWRRR